MLIDSLCFTIQHQFIHTQLFWKRGRCTSLFDTSDPDNTASGPCFYSSLLLVFLNRFRDGLRTLGVLDQIKMYPESFRSLLCHQAEPLTADMVDKLFIIRLSPAGSNRRAAEEVVVPFWRDYLQDVEGKFYYYDLKLIKAPSKRYWKTNRSLVCVCVCVC